MSDDDKDSDDKAEAGEATDKNPATIIREAIERASHSFLKDRFALDEDPDGKLSFPHPDRYKDLGDKAESFVQGFFKGFISKDEDGKTVAKEPSEVPRANDVIITLLAKMTNALSDGFRGYVGENAAEAPKDADGKVVVDGTFVMKHGAPLIGTLMGALGDAFGEDPVQSGARTAESSVAEPQPSDVDFRFDFSKIFQQLLAPGTIRASAPEEE